MIGFLASRFIKDYQNTSDAAVRRAYGVLCGAVGIAINLLLFALKLFAGTLAGSVAVTADAFNNLSDAGASIVTLLGFRLAGQKPDPEHPFGHGRLEYISGLIVSIVILLMGFELLRDAVGAILHPEAVECSVLTVAILLVSICAKFYMYCYNRGVGKKISAAAMQATAADSLSDCAATAAVLLATLAGYFLHWQIDGWCGLVVSLLILWAGVQAARDTLSPLLGQPPSEEFVQEIRDIVMANKAVCGIHDLVVHDYGPGRVMISLHAEVPAHGVGKKISAAAMQATAADSLSDCAATAAVLLATLAGYFLHWQIDGWCGLVVSLLILWAGVQAARDTLSPLLGQPPSEEFVQEIRDIVMANKAVCGIHDLVVHDYGPGRVMISLHAEVPAHGDILTLHDEIDNVEKQLHDKLGCEAVIHMDPIVTNDEAVNVTHQRIAALVRGIDENISIHDFRMVTGPTHTNVIFDAVVPYGCALSDREAEEKIKKAVHELDPSYFAVVQIDKSYVR